MDATVPSASLKTRLDSSTVLAHSATAWFVIAAIGQLIFAFYIAMLYGGAVVRGDLTGWSKVMPRGYIPGDTVGNVTIALHLLFAFTLTVGGLLQLIPHVRARAPRFHRWNGRFFVIGSMIAAIGGLYLLWVRGTVGDTGQHLGTTLNALLILAFAVLAWRYAMQRDFVAHRRWAIRLFLVVSGVWFFRVGLMAWLLIHQKPVGFDGNTFTGPFLTFLTFAQTLIPLALFECYVRAQRADSTSLARYGIAFALVLATLVTALGVVGAAMGMWLPRI
jgi:Predicted membrane protein (DUF2306)